MTKLIDALIKERLVTNDQIREAMEKRIGAKKPVHELLVDMGFVKEEEMLRVASEILRMPVSILENENIDSSLTEIIPYDKAKQYGVFPIREEKGNIIIAMSDPDDIIALDDLSIITNCPVKAVLSRKSSINRFIEKYYQSDDSLYNLLKNIVINDHVKIIKEEVEGKKSSERERNIQYSPIVRLAKLILSDALKRRASDIHIEPQGSFTEVRYRIDGDLRKIMKIPANIQDALTARIKILANLDIAEKKKTQDGRTNVQVGERKVDLRVSILPTFYGEKVVIRLLDLKGARIRLEAMGFNPGDLEIFKKEISKAQGMILVTGPTGSGKTSTLYAALNYINNETKNIVTIENPVEYLISGINQIQVNPDKDVTFANSLRSILRQDPNVIFLGEIRDRETADVAFRAAQTGHMVFSTLHTNNAAATLTRLLDIGLEPFLINSSLTLIIAQRLVKLICPGCKTEYLPGREEVRKFKPYIDKYGIERFYRGLGCEKCAFTGFLGRSAIFEILKIDEDVRKLISDKAPEDVLSREARAKGMKTLAEAGMEKVAEGLTTLEEAASVADMNEVIYPEDKAPEVLPAKDTGSTGNIKILVADDEDDIRLVLKKRLENTGYDVLTAVNGAEAVSLAVKEKPDLIIMDVMMPEMDGFEATKILRSSLETAVIPVLMLTAKRDKESELEGLDAGADDYVTKPFDKDKLLARVKMLLRRTG
jgi:type IV pilus assembly protein PilB